MWKKVLFSLLAAAVVIFAVFSAGVITAYIKPAASEIPETAEVTPAGKITPGAENKYTFEVTLPADITVKSAELFRNGSALSAASVKFAGWYFNKMKWRISGSFRIFETGKADGLSVRVAQEKFFGKNPPALQVNIPEKECAVAENITAGEKLHLAPVPEANELDGVEKSFAQPFYKNWIFYAVIALIIVLCALAAIFFKRKKSAAALPLDQRTLQEIQQICAMVKAKKMRVESGFAALSDIIRNYLEERSGVPATRRTTVEFLHELAANPDFLSAEERIYLTGFLNNADLIKFAGATARPEMLNNAAAEADKLVRTTTAAALEKEKESK
jgi:magnesium-transporting ATPase (P-type)